MEIYRKEQNLTPLFNSIRNDIIDQISNLEIDLAGALDYDKLKKFFSLKLSQLQVKDAPDEQGCTKAAALATSMIANIDTCLKEPKQ
jgi:hypothetical protein